MIVVEALVAESGETIWRYAYQTTYRDDFGFDEGPRSVPVVAEGRVGEVGPVMQRLEGQGVAAVTLVIFALRHFRILHAAASDPGGPGQGIARVKPPVFGPRRDAMLRQAQGWGMHRLEQALRVLTETDLTLRSAGQRGPQMALVERAMIRLAMLARR